MISALVEGSAWMKPPVDGPADAATGAVEGVCAVPPAAVPPSDVTLPPSVVPAVRTPLMPAVGVAGAAAGTSKCCTQNGREVRGIGVLQVDDPDVAGRAAGALLRQIELLYHRAHLRQLGGAGGPDDQRIAARVGQHAGTAAAHRDRR